MKTRSQTKSGQLSALEKEAIQKLSMLSNLNPKRAVVKAPRSSPSRLSHRKLDAASTLSSMSSKRKY